MAAETNGHTNTPVISRQPSLNAASAGRSSLTGSSQSPAATMLTGRTGSQSPPVQPPTKITDQLPTAAIPSSRSQPNFTVKPGSQWSTIPAPPRQSAVSAEKMSPTLANVEPVSQSAHSSPAAFTDQSSTKSSQSPLQEVQTSPSESSPVPSHLPPPTRTSSTSVQPKHTSSPTASPGQAAPPDQPLSTTDQSLTGSASQHNTIFPPDEHPVNISLLTRQAKESLKSSLRRISAQSCAFPCLNGGQCVQSESCDCSLYRATGHRCQTVPNPGFEREMTCRTWGQYNFETFDGLYYYFPGRCTYTLLRDCEETTQAGLVVQVHNDQHCNSAPYTCQRSVSIFLPWEGELRLHATAVTFKGQSLQLPHRIHDLQLEQISQYVLVTRQQGFTLAWEGGGGSVYIKLSPEFVGTTCGMCGNFNADVQDDLRTSYGVLTHDVEMFGNSWVEAEPREAQCPIVPSGFPSPCAAVDAHVLLKVEEVCAMLLDPPFQSCHELVSPLSYMASCSNDLCTSGPSGEAVCQVFSEYARACAHADHPLHDWRQQIPHCERQCSEGLGYRECINCCPASCNLERTCIDSKLACLDGCYCPDGLIYDDGSCVMPSDCSCEYHGMFYPPGHTLQEECNNCTCLAGVWNCTDYNCPGECSVTGDMYFQSFDGRIYTFSATCQYVLAKSRNSGRFTVTIQNTPCGANLDGACIQSVNLVIDEDPRTEITLSHVGEVYRAGQYRISLPYSDDLVHIQELSSMFLQVKTAFGLRLQYSGADFRLYLQADEHWKDDTVGLCGTFNGNIQDDFLSPSGMIESTPQLFGNAWRVSSACVSSLISPQLDPCDTHQQAVAYASEMCDVLNQDLFSACHEHLSPTAFHRQCRSDTCKCGTPCLCSSLAHYAHHCRRFSVVVDFRSQVPDCATTCPPTMQYGPCVSSCQSRCSALSVPQHCGEECEEGCVCPSGTFYNHRTQTCVHRSECPCSFLGADYEPGDVVMTSAGVQLCLNGKLVSQTTGTEKRCPAGQTYQNCSEEEDGLLSGRGVACEQTCESYLLNLTCSTHEPCVPGCSCPPGLLKHGDECFEPASCPCLWKGKEYYPGDRVSSPCHQCVCQHGAFLCEFQPCPSMCTAYGDRHYRTFDGLLYDYIGACKVYLVKSTTDVIFSVAAVNVDCFDSGVICRKSLIIAIDQSVIAFADETGKPSPSSVVYRKQRVFMWSAGYFTVVHFPEEDVTVLWDRKTTIHIQVGPRWQGKLSGLCGNFDTKTVNEMRTPDNLESPTPQEFGNSWTAVECVNSLDMRHPCSLSPLREPFAKRQCAILHSEVFQACHPVVDVTWFYTNCLADTCSCSNGGDCECFCTSVAAYAQRCCHQGVPIDWRSPSLCPYDCEFYNKVLGKGPFRLISFRDRMTLVAVNGSGGSVFLSTSTIPGILSQFMMTPGLSRARPHDTSRVSFEAADRPNFFLYVSPGGQLWLAKWEEDEAFWDAATFILRRNTWLPGYDSLESQAKPSFFLHASPPRIHLLKYRHVDSFRKATLFRLTGPSPDATPGPRCQWRYDSCVVPCFKTCSDPTTQSCTTIPQVEGCLPVCPSHMVLDEVTHRCVYVDDCIKAPVTVLPVTPSFPVTNATTTSSPTTSPIRTTTILSTSPDTGPTFTFGTTSTQTPSAKVSPVPDKPTHLPTTTPSETPEPSSAAGPLSLPTTPMSTVRVTEAPLTTVTSTTSTSSPVTSRTSSAPFAITALFWFTSSTKPTDSLFTTTQLRSPSAPWTMSTIEEPIPTSRSPIRETIEMLTQPSTVTSTITPTTDSVVTDRTTVSSTITTADTGTTKAITVARFPSTTSTATPASLPHTASSSPLQTTPSEKTTTSPPAISAAPTQVVTPVTVPEGTSLSSTTERILHTSPPQPTTTTSELLTSATFPTSTSVPTLAVTDWRTATPKKATTKDTTLSGIPGVASTTPAAPPPNITDTPLSPVPTSTLSYERTSMSPQTPPTERSTQTLASTPEVDEISPISTAATAASPPKTTTGPPLPKTDTSTQSLTTTQTSEPHHVQTTSTPVHTTTVTSEFSSSVHVTSTTEAPRLAVTSTPVTTSVTPVVTTVTTTKAPAAVSTAEIPATTTRKLVTPPPVLSVAETTVTTVSARPPPASTTFRPVVVVPVTETTHPVSDRVETFTKTTTSPSPSWSPRHTTVSTMALVTTADVEGTTTQQVSFTSAALPTTTSTTASDTSRVSAATSPPRIVTSRRPSDVPVPANTTAETAIPATSGTATAGTPSTTLTTSTTAVSTASTIRQPITSAANMTSGTVPEPAHLPSTMQLSTTVPTTTTRETSETTTTKTDASPSTAQPTLTLISTLTPSVPTSVSASPSAATTSQTTEWERVGHTSPGVPTTPPTSPWPYTPSKTTHIAEVITATAVSPVRTCIPPYAEIVDECTKYICVNNQLVLFNKSQSCPFASFPPNCGLLGFAVLVNGDKCCPKWECPCRCSMFPDLNVITFDGNSVAIYKAASYVVTKLPNETVTVLVQECPADAESTLFWNFTNLCLVALNITHKSNHVTINRLQRRLYVNLRYAKPRFKKFGFEVYDTGNMYLIRSPAGLKLQWFHSTGMMVIETESSSNKLSTMGLCGFCDGDPRNDLTLASGTVLGEGEDPTVFIDSWQIPNTTSYISQSRRRELNCSTSDCSACFDMLQSSAFLPCHDFVPPSTFCDLWVKDEEYVNNQCVALAAYVASCHKFNVCMEWRRPDHCPFTCPDTLQYQACLTACTSQSCPNHDLDSDPDQCSGLTEGCVCPEGTLLHRPYSALCISPEKCACTDSAGVPRAHGEVWKASKDGCCMYLCDSDTIVPVEYNCSSVATPMCHRAGEMIISLADDASCCPRKVCVCNQSLCDLLPPECKYGEKLVSYYRQDSCCPDYMCECSPDLCESDIPSCRDDQTLIAARAEGSCCLAHICMCSSCLEAPPVCLQGEVLTVDANTTDRCCPSYQCACNPHRCPQLTCPIGMAVESVSTPDHCCPNQTCECSCEKITSPKCGPGEAAQLDRAFLSDPRNQCACKRYKCVREAVCVFGERGVLRPGQTLVERNDSGLCVSRQCSRSLDPASGFYLLRTSSINCSAHCQPNQIYTPPKDQSTCCGVCKNISCLYEHENGTTLLYKPGRSWVSNCMKFDCADTLSGPTLISYSFSCPPFNETECTKVGGTVVSYMDGCCKTCTGFTLFPFPVSPLTPTVNTNCERGKEDGKSCQKVTVRMTIRKNDCRSNRPVNIVSCDGKCPSASIYNYNINTYARFCKCCRETGLQRRFVQLYCSSNSTWVSYSIQEPTDCSCQWS
ncbi:otogelin [Takifugu rubripes]|uniref:otogelin n=1 Tax=Takifugu rubripes TaxID=31033 RepID=UPI001145CE8F|nr:otogelin-like [Takifugu rubripes]